MPENYQESWDFMQEIKRLRQTMRDVTEILNRQHWAYSEVKKIMARPEVRRALDDVYEGVVR